MLKGVGFALVLLIAVGGQAEAQPTLLGSISREGLGGTGCRSDSMAITFYLCWSSEALNLSDILLGHDPGVHWHDGETGYYDYTSENEVNFNGFAEGITNGSDDYIRVCYDIVDGGGACLTRSESAWGLGDPDLFGCQVTSIRLVVHEVNLSRTDDWIDYSYSITWEFWGPGPSAAAFDTWGQVKRLYR